MRAWPTVCLASVLLSSGVARAVSEASVDAASVVQEKVDREGRSPSVAESLRLVRASREADQKRAERIRDLPPERVQEWIDGKLSEAEVGSLASEPQAQPVPESVAAVVFGNRLSRLMLASLAVLVLAFVYARQHRRERRGDPE